MTKFFVLVLCGLALRGVCAENPNFVLVWQSVSQQLNGTNVEYQYTTRTFDTAGHLVGSIVETDTDLDGVKDERSTSTGTQDEHGNVTNWVSEVVAIGSSQLLTRYESRAMFDRHGQLTNAINLGDVSGDGSFEFTSQAAYEYDHKGRIVEIRQKTVSGPFVETLIDSRSYDARGEMVRDVTQRQSGAGPTMTTWTIWTYGAASRPRTRLMLYDGDGDGLADPGRVETVFESALPGLPSTAINRAVGPDGLVTWRSREEFAYDQHRNLSVHRESIDDEGDGVIDRVIEVRQGWRHR